MTHRVQHAMHDYPRQLFPHRDLEAPGLVAHHLGRHVMSPTSGDDAVWRPNANVMTSVSPRWPRCRLFMALMVRRETKAMDNMADGTRSRFRTKSARLSKEDRAPSDQQSSGRVSELR